MITPKHIFDKMSPSGKKKVLRLEKRISRLERDKKELDKLIKYEEENHRLL